MGTRFEIVMHAPDAPRAQAVAEEALREISHWHARLSRFEASSDVARINREGRSRPVRVDRELYDLLRLCQRIQDQSSGCFDPCLGDVMDGRRRSARTGARLVFDDQRLSVGLTGSGEGAIDLGAIAKGFAVDRAAAILREHDTQRALIHGGTSSIAAIGHGPAGDGWPIAVRSAGESMLRLTLRDECLGVSAARGRVLADDPVHGPMGHVLRPHDLCSTPIGGAACVRGPSAALCDAWSTAVLVDAACAASLNGSYTAWVHAGTGDWRTPRFPVGCA